MINTETPQYDVAGTFATFSAPFSLIIQRWLHYCCVYTHFVTLRNTFQNRSLTFTIVMVIVAMHFAVSIHVLTCNGN